MKNFDYSKCMMLKILMSLPDNNGKSKIYTTFEEALDKIKQIDIMTLGIKKIIYLVGWQYLGHDDKYPAFFAFNEALKRKKDKTASESYFWLVEEAKRFNTIVSVHINLSDAYKDSPLWHEYLKKNLILLGRGNKPKITGVWNGRTAYQVCLQREFSSGAFAKRANLLIELLKLKETKTVHIDAFFVRNGKNARIKYEKIARIKMAEYFKTQGIDVTTEFIYREMNCGLRLHTGKSDCLKTFDAYWNLVLSKKDVTKFSVFETSGGVQCNTLTRDKKLHYLFYGNMQGEEIFKKGGNWEDTFIKEFITYTLAYYYLNHQNRERIEGFGNGRKLYHTGGVTTYIKDKKITKDGVVVKIENDVCLPLHWSENTYLAYNDENKLEKWQLSGKFAEVYHFSDKSWQSVGVFNIEENFMKAPNILGAFMIKCFN